MRNWQALWQAERDWKSRCYASAVDDLDEEELNSASGRDEDDDCERDFPCLNMMVAKGCMTTLKIDGNLTCMNTT